MRSFIIVLCSLSLLAGCGNDESGDVKKELTRQQKDSVLSESVLPGASVVGSAISVSDSAAARAKRLDEMSK
ncbi:MAG: hypothetical protein KOO63_15915 [Bacteroidales bacterium]|nr:hypothetical protein [Candidatus Latescibacterota bacterium]